jgi:endonuclease-3
MYYKSDERFAKVAPILTYSELWQKGNSMRLRARTDKIRKILRSIYPSVKTQLIYDTPFQLLVATMLSAQCTDKQVNRVTQVMFKYLKTPADFSAASIQTIEGYIRSTGFYRNKARNIKNCSRKLLEIHDGRIPQTLAELVELPGVGRKTANVVLGAAFKIPGIVVDTHVARISGRLGLTANTDPVKIEFDLMKIIPKSAWHEFGLQLIHFGRKTCLARKPKCPICPLGKLCHWPQKT